MNRKQIIFTSGVSLWIATAVLMFRPSVLAAAPFQMPALRGFVKVDPGADLKRPPDTLPSRATRLSLDTDDYPTDDRQIVNLELEGSVAPGGSSGDRQFLTFESPGTRRPVRITLRPPFDLSRLIPEATEGELHYRDRYEITDYNRSLVLLLEGTHRLQIVEAGAMEPVILEARGGEIDLGPPGLTVRQGGAGASADDPSHDYTYPVPVEVETADGTVTWLWQGQWVEFPTSQDGRTVYFLLLTSEVAKPTGDAASVFEGALFNLQVLLVTQDR